MQDDYSYRQMRAPKRPSALRRFLTIFGIVVVFAGAAVGALVWNGNLRIPGLSFGKSASADARLVQSVASPALPPVLSAKSPGEAAGALASATPTATSEEVSHRLVELEERLSRLDLRATAASGNAARAEGLLIAFAARRTIDRGAPLGYLEDQLRLRFADAQPNAVATIVEGASKQITLDSLLAQLDALAPKLTGTGSGDTILAKARSEIASLFVIRKDDRRSLRPKDRIERARLFLIEGKISDAVAEVEQLPGIANAGAWITAARRYDDVRRALDLIETTAMLEPHRLQDGEGRKVDQPSPLAGASEG